MLKSFFNRLISKKKIKILVVGRYLSGKRSILGQLNHLLGEKAATPTPTTGPGLPTIQYKNTCFTTMDIQLQDEISSSCPEFFQNTQGLVFVVDGTGKDNIAEVKDELHKLLNKDELSDTAVLVFINKKDRSDSMDDKEVINNLGLPEWTKNHWHFVSTCARTGDGFEAGFDWLTNEIINKMLDSASSVEFDMEFAKNETIAMMRGKVDAIPLIKELYKELNNSWSDLDVQAENLLKFDLEESIIHNNNPTKEAQERAAIGSLEWTENVKGVRNAAADHFALSKEKCKSLKSSIVRLS